MSLINMLLNFDKDLSDVFVELNRYNYALIQRGDYSQSINFPKDFILGEDVDIFICMNDLKSVAIMIKSMLDEKFLMYGIRTKIIEKESGMSIKACYLDDLIIEFDLIVKMQSLSNEFMRNSIAKSNIIDGVKRLLLNDELNYRLAAFSNSGGSKLYHAKFVLEHGDSFSFVPASFENPDEVFQNWNKYKNEYGEI